MAYIAAADFRERTVKPYTAGLVLGEGDGTDAYLDLIITATVTRVELDLNDDFEPPSPDNDEVVEVDGSGTMTLFLPRRTRSLTTVKTRDTFGSLITQDTAAYRLSSSLNATGTAMIYGRTVDYLEALNISTVCWPYGVYSMQLTGKFGWGAVPDDIKRLVSLRVYDLVKAKADPLTTITQRITVDSTYTFGESAEITDIERRYRRVAVMVG